MSNRFVRIGTGEKFNGELPNIIDLPVHHDGEVPWTEEVTYREGDVGWEDALFRFMFLNGYCFPEDNLREMPGLSRG